MAKTTIPHNPSFEGLLALLDNIPFASPDGGQLTLQMIKPQWSSGGRGFPLVLFIQGSAWTKPNQFWQLPQMNRLAECGYVIASVTHRSCWDVPAPAFLQDVKTALRFLRANAQKYDINKERVCAWGTSSGGNTALLMGVTADDPAFEGGEWPGESTAVQAVVDCFGPAELVGFSQRSGRDITKEEGNILYALGGSCPDTYLQRLKWVSPANYVKPGQDLPPFLLLYGDADDVVPYEEGEKFYRLLTENGYEADLVRVTEGPHEGTFWSRQLLYIIFDFIRRQLERT